MRKISLPTRQDIELSIGADKTELFGSVYDAIEALQLASEFLDAVKYYEPKVYERASNAYNEQQSDI